MQKKSPFPRSFYILEKAILENKRSDLDMSLLDWIWFSIHKIGLD